MYRLRSHNTWALLQVLVMLLAVEVTQVGRAQACLARLMRKHALLCAKQARGGGHAPL